MKCIHLIVLLFLFGLLGCVTHPSRNMQVVVRNVAGTNLSSAEIDSLRSGEVIKKYYVGAYVDPAHPNVRHDPHIVERIEQSSRWNLRPNIPVVASGPTYKAVSENALKNAMQQQYDHEMQQQRLASTQAQAQVDELRRQVDSLKATLQQQNENGLKQIEEKIDVLSEKIKTVENSKRQPSNTTEQHQINQLTQLKTSQGNRSWEVPIQE